MRRLFFHVLMLMRTQPDSQARTTNMSAMLDAGVVCPRFRDRIVMRIRIGIKANVIKVQSRAMKPAGNHVSSCGS